jgi:hypothetical protein
MEIVCFGSRLCENFNVRRARRSIFEKLRDMRTDNAADIRLNAMLGNCIFYISPMYEFSHSLGQKRTYHRKPKSTVVRCYSNSDHSTAGFVCPRSSRSGLMHRSKKHLYSITSSARVSSCGGTVRPSALAVLRLMTKSYLIGCWTGRSEGLAPFKILST